MGIWAEAIMRWVGDYSTVMASGQNVIKYRVDSEGRRRSTGNIPDCIDIIAGLEAGGQAHIQVSNISGFGPVGDVVEGTEAHIEFLTEWFETNNPKWNLLWAISNTGQTPEGESLDFVTAGHEVKLSLDGDEVTVYQVIDANISDGKIVNFNVFQQERGQSSSD